MGDIFDQVAEQQSSKSSAPTSGQDIFDQVENGQAAPQAQSEPQTQPGPVQRFVQNFANNTPLAVLKPPEDINEQAVHAAAGAPGLALYRMARGIVDSVGSLTKAKGDDYHNAISNLQQMMSDSSLGKSAVEQGIKFWQQVQGGDTAGAIGGATGKLATAGAMAVAPELGAEEEALAEEAATKAPAKPSLIQEIVKGEKVAQEPATQKVAQTAQSAAKSASVEAPSGNPVNSFGEAGDSVIAKAKTQYKALDDATGGRFQRFQDRLDNIRDKLGELTGTEEDVQQEAKLLKAQKETEDAMNEAFEDARAKGIDPTMIDQARAAYKQGNALKDLDAQVFRSRIVESTDKTGQSNLVNPSKLLPRLQQMYKSGRLSQAVGEDNAIDLLKQTKDFVATGIKAAKLQSKVATVGRVTGKAALGGIVGGGLAGLTYELVKQ